MDNILIKITLRNKGLQFITKQNLTYRFLSDFYTIYFYTRPSYPEHDDKITQSVNR